MFARFKLPQKCKGFTLTELLIGLAVLAVLAAFSIPKVMQMQNEAQKRSIFKASLQAMRHITMEMATRGENLAGSAGITALYNRLGAVQICAAGNTTCQTYATGDLSQGAILPNGTHLYGFNPAGSIDGFWMDYNGRNAPNLVGEDILALYRINQDNTSICALDNNGATITTQEEAGAIELWPEACLGGWKQSGSSNNDVLWNAIWQ